MFMFAELLCISIIYKYIVDYVSVAQNREFRHIAFGIYSYGYVHTTQLYDTMNHRDYSIHPLLTDCPLNMCAVELLCGQTLLVFS